MDLSTVTDPTELKALVYDRLVVKEQAEREIGFINQRLKTVLDSASKAAEAVIEDTKDQASHVGKRTTNR